MYFTVYWGTILSYFYFLAVHEAWYSTNSDLLAVLSCPPSSPSNPSTSITLQFYCLAIASTELCELVIASLRSIKSFCYCYFLLHSHKWQMNLNNHQASGGSRWLDLHYYSVRFLWRNVNNRDSQEGFRNISKILNISPGTSSQSWGMGNLCMGMQWL